MVLSTLTRPDLRAIRKHDQDIVDQVYESVAGQNNGRIASLDDVIAAVILDPASSVEREAAYIIGLVETVDKRKVERGHSAQLNLFSGQPDALDGYLALGDGRRVQVRHAMAVDWADTLGLRAENLANVAKAYHTVVAQHAKIAPYLAQGMATDAAVLAYMRDHP